MDLKYIFKIFNVEIFRTMSNLELGAYTLQVYYRDISANKSSADVAYSCMLNCNMKLSRKNKMISHTGCANNKSTISIHLGTALAKLLPQSSGVWLHCHCNTFFLRHPVVDLILSKWSWSCCTTQFHPCFSLCFVSTILWYTEEPHGLFSDCTMPRSCCYQNQK